MRVSVVKERVLLLLVLICFSLVTYGIINIRRLPNQVAKVNALPITNKVIVVDAGHGLPDEGAFLLHKENKQLTFYK